MQPHPAAPRHLRDGADFGLGKDRAAAAVVGVLHHHQRGRGVVGIVGGMDGLLDVGGGEQPVGPPDRLELQAGEGARGAALEQHAVGAGAAQHLLTRAGGDGERDLVGHGARGDEQACLLAQQAGHPFLEQSYRRVLAENVVPHLGARDRLAHAGCRTGDGVGAEIDGWRRRAHG